MSIFGIPGHGLKHVTTVALGVKEKTAAEKKKEGKGKGRGRPLIWELDVGPRTVNEIVEASGLSRPSVYRRLNSGERRWAVLIAPRNKEKSVDGLKSHVILMKDHARKGWLIKSDKAAYYAKLKEGHKKL